MFESIRYMALCVVAVFMLAACSREVPLLSGATMGTTYSVIVPHLKNRDKEPLKVAIDDELRQINNAMSTWQDDSTISRFNASESTDWFAVSADFALVADASISIANATDGAFDPTIGPLIRRWGFGREESTGIPSDDEIALLMQQTGFENFAVDAENQVVKKSNKEIQLDLNAIAKGYAVDQLASHVKALGYDDFLVEIGGELRVSGRNSDGDPWRVGIETPGVLAGGSDIDVSGNGGSGNAASANTGLTNNAQAGLKLTNGGVATSGDYRNAFEQDGRRYSHIIDARHGAPITHSLASVTVVAESAMLADGWATALMVLGPDDGMKIAEELEIACLFIVRDDVRQFRVTRSSAFPRLHGHEAVGAKLSK